MNGRHCSRPHTEGAVESVMLSSKIVKGATLKVYPGLSHGLCSTNKDQINVDLLAFLQT
jgi:non-heme chloroperoxidase